jgi:hypothetical protein
MVVVSHFFVASSYANTAVGDQLLRAIRMHKLLPLNVVQLEDYGVGLVQNSRLRVVRVASLRVLCTTLTRPLGSPSNWNQLFGNAVGEEVNDFQRLLYHERETATRKLMLMMRNALMNIDQVPVCVCVCVCVWVLCVCVCVCE